MEEDACKGKECKLRYKVRFPMLELCWNTFLKHRIIPWWQGCMLGLCLSTTPFPPATMKREWNQRGADGGGGVLFKMCWAFLPGLAGERLTKILNDAKEGIGGKWCAEQRTKWKGARVVSQWQKQAKKNDIPPRYKYTGVNFREGEELLKLNESLGMRTNGSG